LILCVFWAEQVSAGTFGVFDPEAFVRTKNVQPDIYTASFPVLSPDTLYILKVYNGGKKGSTVTGTPSSNVTLYLNRELIELPDDFKRKKAGYAGVSGEARIATLHGRAEGLRSDNG
jgi:hypothetical protein